MAFGHKAKPTRAYAYHANLLSDPTPLRQEMVEAGKLWNALVELDHDLTEQQESAADLFLGMSQEEHDVRKDALIAQLQAARGNELALKEAYAAEDAVRVAHRPAWKAPAVKEACQEIDERGVERSYELAQGDAYALWWPNRNAQRMSFLKTRTRRKTARAKGQAVPGPLRFQRLNKPRRLVLQFAGGLPVDKLVAGEFDGVTGSKFAQMTAVDPLAWQHPDAGERRRRCHTPLRLWVASGGKGVPIYADFDLVMHRPLPAGGAVKEIYITCDIIATQQYWTVIFVVATPPAAVTTQRGGCLWLDLGWRRMPDGLRVAVWRDDFGNTGDITLDNGWLQQRAKVDDMQSIRDGAFDQAKRELSTWLTTHDAPDWLREECRYMHQWHQQGRLVVLLQRWREQRFPGDYPIYSDLADSRSQSTGRRNDWLARDRHLWQYGSHLYDQLLANRRERYRIFAAETARNYGMVVFEDADWAALAVKEKRGTRAVDPDTQRERAIEDAAKRHKGWAAVSTLELALQNAMHREGGVVNRAAAQYTTALCSYCGSCERWDHVLLTHTCSQCGTTWDQDENTARLLSVI